MSISRAHRPSPLILPLPSDAGSHRPPISPGFPTDGFVLYPRRRGMHRTASSCVWLTSPPANAGPTLSSCAITTPVNNEAPSTNVEVQLLPFLDQTPRIRPGTFILFAHSKHRVSSPSSAQPDGLYLGLVQDVDFIGITDEDVREYAWVTFVHRQPPSSKLSSTLGIDASHCIYVGEDVGEDSGINHHRKPLFSAVRLPWTSAVAWTTAGALVEIRRVYPNSSPQQLSEEELCRFQEAAIEDARNDGDLLPASEKLVDSMYNIIL